MPGAKIVLADCFSRHPVGEALRVSLYDHTFTVAELRSINNSFVFKSVTTTGVANAKSRLSNDSDIKSQICKYGCTSPPDENGKSCDLSATNHNAAMCISECNDREGAKVVKSITECQFSESNINSIPSKQIYNFPKVSIILKNLNKILLRYSEIIVKAAVK